jgi:trimeric autotransporter adhesin
MKKQRMLVGAVLTAGLGLTGLVSANASGATAPTADRSATAKAVGSASGKGGRVHVCVVKVGRAAGKATAGKATAGQVTTGKATAGKATTATPVTGGTVAVSKARVKIVDGKVYVNGKPAPVAKLITKCDLPLPPLGAGHKGVVCIVKIGPGGGKATGGGRTLLKGDRTAVKAANGKIYLNGKPAPVAKLGGKCSKVPSFPVTGAGGKTHPAQPGTAVLGG